MHKVITIDSDTPLVDIDSHFKVVAGPGAGKTYWLIKHVKNVLSKSKLLSPASQIACISFTNIASKEINKRLGDHAHRVWVSTIHSFLYHNIVKPYVWLLKDENGDCLVNPEELKGHGNHYITYGTIRNWLAKCENGYRMNYMCQDVAVTSTCLNSITWEYEDGEWIVTVPRGVVQSNLYNRENREPLSFPSTRKEELMRFKYMCWKQGDISHNDVLYLSIGILEEHPELTSFLTAAFPYIFADEFQDTSPMQTELLKKLGQGGATIGVIGDPGQSIYAFNGASPEDFSSFTLPGMMEYKIEGNRRSTVQIVKFLNAIRLDSLTQHAIREECGAPVTILVGSSSSDAANALREHLEKQQIDTDGEKKLAVLARSNHEVFSIRNMHEDAAHLWSELDDSDSDRAYFYRHIIEFVEFARIERLDEAASCLSAVFPKKGGKLRPPLKKDEDSYDYVFDALALTLLNALLPFWVEPYDTSLLDINNSVMRPLLDEKYAIKLTPFTRGKIKTLAENTRLADLIQASQISDDMEQVRTVHKAKGCEFDIVLLCLKDESDFTRYLTNRKPKKDEIEEVHVRYVAASRAMDRLYIHVPELSRTSRREAGCLNMRILDIG